MVKQLHFFRIFSFFLLAFLYSSNTPVFAQTEGETVKTPDIISTLKSFSEVEKTLQGDLNQLNKEILRTHSDEEKVNLKKEVAKLNTDLDTTRRNFENVAAGIDISSLREKPREDFNLQKEILGLLKPAIDEMKSMTSRVRQKSDLKEKIDYFTTRLPTLQKAISNVDLLIKNNKDATLNKSLKAVTSDWKKQQAFMESELHAAQLELDKIVSAETSLAEASQNYLKSFFKKRGLYLTIAFLLVALVILLSRFSHKLMTRALPGFKQQHRPFKIRLLELLHHIATIILTILGPMIVFYVVEDWVLFSLSILVILGILWTLRQALPRYWHQVQIFLNIGSVREGERVVFGALPWQVKQINLFTTLYNPTAELTQRIPISDLVDMRSRPMKKHEPWFPCKLGDWVILNDGVRGKVTGISPELVQLIQRGGASVTYQMGDFLANNPRNLALNFRIKEIFGISYKHQKEITNKVLDIIDAAIRLRANEEGYGDKLINLRVEFAQASSSSLDIAIIADFKGELGELYNRLHRSIQRWCVDVCTEEGWEIPFPQLTLSGSLSEQT